MQHLFSGQNEQGRFLDLVVHKNARCRFVSTWLQFKFGLQVALSPSPSFFSFTALTVTVVHSTDVS